MSKKKNVKKAIDTSFEEIMEPVNDSISELSKTSTNNNKFKLGDIIKVVFVLFVMNSVFAYLGYKIYNAKDIIENTFIIINYSLLIILTLLFGLTVLFNKKAKNVFGILASFMLIVIVAFNILVEFNVLKLPKQDTVPDFKGKTINEALIWANKHNINVEQIFEFSDNINDTLIITQDISPNTLLKNIEKIKLIVSSGPDFNKEVTISNMVGLTLKDLEKFIKDNKLNKVAIEFEIKDDIKRDDVISQSKTGSMKRNDEIKFVISLGPKNLLEPVKMIDLSNKSEFDAILWVKRNGISYKIDSDFSNKVKKGFVLSQSIASGKMIDPKTDTLTIVISKGKEIIVPDLISMSVDKIVKWITDNDLKINYAEAYSSYIAAGKVMLASVKEGEKITEGTVITVTTSKGQLKFPSFDTIQSFRSWAMNNNIKYKEEFEFSDSHPSGKIISFSLKTGDTVILEDTILAKVSYGKAISVPNLIGMSKGQVTNSCSNLGLNCTFWYTGYSNAPVDQATGQNVTAGNKVVSGTNVSVALSPGPAKTFTVHLTSDLFGLTADATITSIRNYLNSAAPGVTFNFTKRASNGCPYGNGFVHPDSPIISYNNNVTQGRTYSVVVINC